MNTEPISENCRQNFQLRNHICFGISPFNSYFSEERIRDLALWGKSQFESMHFFVPDVPSSYTLEALGYPWYYKIPGIKQLLDSDISEARHHLDFTDGYPFKSHATPVEDLDAIGESIQKRSMPPWSYRLMHSDSAMTDEEKKSVLDWVETSKTLLKP